jgi:hypothetical protein
MTQLSSLRALLTEDPLAATVLSDALVAGGRPRIAEEWLTEALEVVLRNHRELESESSEQRYDEMAMIAYELLRARHDVRNELGLPHDDHDDLADEMLDELDEAFDIDEIPAVMFLPQPEYAEVLRRWPELTLPCGSTWDEHRALTERALRLLAEYGAVRLAVVAGSADGLGDFAAMKEYDQIDIDVVRAYSDSLQGARNSTTSWPPGRNEPCWCGSTTKYKKCCLPRT